MSLKPLSPKSESEDLDTTVVFRRFLKQNKINQSLLPDHHNGNSHFFKTWDISYEILNYYRNELLISLTPHLISQSFRTNNRIN